MLDVALEDLHYINYHPLRIHQSLDFFLPPTSSSSSSYTDTLIAVKQEFENLDMQSGYHVGEDGIEPDHVVPWPAANTTEALPPWNAQGEFGPLLTPTQHRQAHTQNQQPEQQQQIGPQTQQQQQQQQQQQSDLSLLYGGYKTSLPSQQHHPLPMMQNANQDGPQPGSYNQAPSSSSLFMPVGLYSTPSGLSSEQPTVTSSPDCLCSMLGQVCTCARRWTRPQVRPLDQSFTSSSSSSTGGMGDSNSSHSSLVMSPVQMQRPSYDKRTSSHLATDAPSMSTNWLQDGRSMPAYPTDDSADPQTSFPHPINTHLSSQMSALQQSPEDSPSSAQAQVPHPALSYLYEVIPPSDDAINASSSHDGGTAANSVATSPSTEMDLSLAGPIAGSTAMVPDQYPSRSGYRSADSGLPQRAPRSSTTSSAVAPPMGHSVSQMSLTSSHSHYHPYSVARTPLLPSSSAVGVPGYNGYKQQARNEVFPSSSTIASSSRSSTANNYEPVGTSASSSSSTGRFITEEERWNAVLNRIHSADAYFVYGALTTRIYCRPSCASKRPDRNRVVFFSFPDAANKAEYAGFRACKRCKPRTPGTADVCVLAVGQCLRHITQAALLGESEEIDARLKKKTLKEYSSDYGVSAFHFHRTLKSVSTLTPGDYSKACHALVLQDEIGMDRQDGQTLTSAELQQRLRGWSSRRARRAVGNILPSTYARGFPNMRMYYIYAPDTRFGKVCILYFKGEEASFGGVDQISHPLDAIDNSNLQCTVMAALIGEDALIRVQKRAPQAVAVPSQTAWLRSLVEDLDRKGLREVQMPQEVVPWVRRARVWFAVKNALEPRSRAAGKRANNSENDDEEEYDEGDDEEGSPMK